MPDHIGIVVKDLSGGKAEVVTDRKGGCGGCQPNHGGCRSCLSTAKTVSLVANPTGARPGDVVKIHIASGRMLAGAALLYVFPVTMMLIGALINVGYLSPRLGWPETPAGILGAVLGAGLSYLVIRWLNQKPEVVRRFSPEIVQILQKDSPRT